MSDVKFDKALRIHKGLFVHNPYELVEYLNLISDKEFKDDLHRSSINNWLLNNYHDNETFAKLKKVKTRKQYLYYLGQMIKIGESEKYIDEQIKVKPTGGVIVGVLAIIALFWVLQAFDYGSPTEYVSENQRLLEQTYDYEQYIQNQESVTKQLKTENKNLRNEISQIKGATQIILPKEEEAPSPRDRIKLSDIRLTDNNLIVTIANPVVAEFMETGSMLPVLSSTTTAIQIIPEAKSDIHPGDIVSYRLESGSIIIHRVIEVGTDFTGWYAITKGDNNPLPDKDKVRFEQIERILIAIFY